MDINLSPEEQARLCGVSAYTIDQQCSTGGFECTISDDPQEAPLLCQVDPPQYFQCPYYNVSGPCEVGYYCPDADKKKACSKGFFCPLGSSRPYECPFSLLSCPMDKMEYPLAPITFLVYIIIFTSALIIQKYFALKMLEMNEMRLTDQTDEESHTLTQEQESDQYKKTLMALSEQICERPTMKMAALRTIRHARAAGPSKKSIESAARAKNNWRKLLKSRAFQEHVQMMKDRASNLVNQMTGSFVFAPVENPLTIAFNHLSLDLKSNGNTILNDIFGCFRPFNITALMGSSGAGKTTLLTLLRGKAHFAVSTGEIRVNGALTHSLTPFADVMAYVPQDDIMYDELTVSENLKYSALLFNKRGYTQGKEVIPMVHHAMELLGLSFVKHSVVGSPEVKGISGGQKKRVSIGMELMKEPSLFFLDEPTSGLDSASSISLMNSLAKISQSGVNIVATLHQPRIEIFDIINVLYLLAPGGRVAYFGPGFGLGAHMRKLGFNCPASSNISDFVMDVISGFVTPAWDRNATVKETVTHICDFTYETMHSQFEKDVLRSRQRTSSGIYGKAYTDEELRNMKSNSTNLNTFNVTFRRQLKIYYRTVASSITPPFVHLLMGVLISKLFGTVRLDGDIASQVMSSQLAFAITIQPVALRLFLSDSLIRSREDQGGINLTPLYAGKLFGNFMDLIISPLAFTCGYYPFLRALAPIHEYLWLFFLLMLTITGLTNMCAILFSKRAGTIAGGILIILWAVGGIEPTVTKTRKNLGVLGEIFVFLTPFRKTYEMAITMELSRHSEYYKPMVKVVYQFYSLKEGRYGMSVLYLLCHWIVTNLIGLIAMVFMRDHYRYWRNFKDDYVYPIIDNILTSDLFIWVEKQYDSLHGCSTAMDNKVTSWFRGMQYSLGLIEDEDAVCDLYLQELLMMPEKTLDSLCDRCHHGVNEHRRQKPKTESKWTWSSQARQRNKTAESQRDLTQSARSSARNVFTHAQGQEHLVTSSGLGEEALKRVSVRKNFYAVKEEDEDEEDSDSDSGDVEAQNAARKAQGVELTHF